jgi:hypothetical protein
MDKLRDIVVILTLNGVKWKDLLFLFLATYRFGNRQTSLRDVHGMPIDL